MNTIGTALTPSETRILLLGSGELGKEFAISALRLGLHVIAVDHYANAPAMQVAQSYCVVDMQDPQALKATIARYQPHIIVPEVEAIATDVLVEIEANSDITVAPCALATKLTMNRQGIRQLASESLGLKTSPYAFASERSQYIQAIDKIGLPCVVKPVVSSSGKGQSIVRTVDEVDQAWDYALANARGKSQTIIIEAFVPFDYEITLLTVRHRDGTNFCAPIGHIQKDGDYQYSWQPHAMSGKVLEKAQHIAKTITDGLGGYGIFGVELFICGDEVLFNEVSPRPHDTGMVTLHSQQYTQFDLHLRAILGLPTPTITTLKPTASAALLLKGKSTAPVVSGIAEAMTLGEVRLFSKPTINGKRRMGVALAQGESIEEALETVRKMREMIKLNH